MKLLERDSQLASLDGWLVDAARGHGSLVFIGGEAGAGKTSLLDGFCHRCAGRARILRGQCDPLSTPQPLGPLHDIASVVRGELDGLLSESVVARDRLFRVVLAELDASLVPALFVIEDAQWADDATLDLIRFLGRRVGSLRSLVLVTYRDDDFAANQALRHTMGDLAPVKANRRLTVSSLSVEGVRTISAGSNFDPDELFQLTGGNPFYLTQVLAGDGTIPATVRDSVLSRLDRLPPGAIAAIEVCAAIGPVAPINLLVEVCGADSEAIEEALQSGLLITRGNDLGFRHEIVRETVLSTLSPIRRRTIHGGILQVMSGLPNQRKNAAALAHHADEAGDGDAVLTFAPLAAHQAATLGSQREAAHQYARALRYASELASSGREMLLELYADTTHYCGWSAETIASRQELIAIARANENRDREALHLRLLATALVVAGRNGEAEQAIEASRALVEGTPETLLHAAIYSTVSLVRMLNRDTADAVWWGERALTLADTFNEARTVVAALNAMGAALLTAGDEQRGSEHLLRGLSRATTPGCTSMTLTNLGSGFGEIHRFSLAETYLLQAIDHATEHDIHGLLSYNLAWLALTRVAQGRWDEATALAGQVLRTPSAVAISRMMAAISLGKVRARRGDPEFRAPLDEALALAAPTGTLQRLAPVHAARAEAAWLSGDRNATLLEARSAFELAVLHRHEWFAGELAYWQDVAGSPPDGHFEMAEPYRLQRSGDWRGAFEAWEARDCPYEAARALSGSKEEADLRRALEMFDQLGARPAAAAVTRALREIGARGIPRGPRPTSRSNPAGLTNRECEIVPLLAAGKRNSEIAEDLFLSPKTVDHHVGNILAKLSLRSRGEIAAVADRLGLLTDSGQNGASLTPT